jgi:hypothetical protein
VPACDLDDRPGRQRYVEARGGERLEEAELEPRLLRRPVAGPMHTQRKPKPFARPHLVDVVVRAADRHDGCAGQAVRSERLLYVYSNPVSDESFASDC